MPELFDSAFPSSAPEDSELDEFRCILIDNGLLDEGMPIGEEWLHLLDELGRLKDEAQQVKEQPLDAAELIQIIKVLSGKNVTLSNVKQSVSIKNEALKNHLLLSLHKWLYSAFHFDLYAPFRDSMEFHMPGAPCKETAKVNLNRGEGDKFKPFSYEELDSLLALSKALNEARKEESGREGKNRAKLGNLVIRIKEECPYRVWEMNQTARLNFIADLMLWAGFLDDVPGAKEHKEDEDRQARKDDLRNWVGAAKRVEEKTFFKDCKKCADLNQCEARQWLQQFDTL